MKKVSILKYDLKKVPITKKTLIHRALYGYTDHSNKGKYAYKRKGALSEIEFTKISNGVIMVDTDQINNLKKIFKKYLIKISVINLIMP